MRIKNDYFLLEKNRTNDYTQILGFREADRQAHIGMRYKLYVYNCIAINLLKSATVPVTASFLLSDRSVCWHSRKRRWVYILVWK